MGTAVRVVRAVRAGRGLAPVRALVRGRALADTKAAAMAVVADFVVGAEVVAVVPPRLEPGLWIWTARA